MFGKKELQRELEQKEQQIQELVSRVLEKEKFAMSTMALDNLAVHLEVAVERIRTGHAIESSDGMQADLPERILEVASHIAVQIENMTGVAFPLPEVCYIAMHLNGKQMFYKIYRKKERPYLKQKIKELNRIKKH